ncbi:cysteine-rich venom protein 1-like [Ceratina calcarata]|uniref:Cysteine-rich venom protein 1-like n=1 Tax=Ceratina calcarata TaxID=156304 RepID=A0AAJ7J0M8_9HYME|nr:cysteine-rich venom protein 1-like [Ceratina calcarata]
MFRSTVLCILFVTVIFVLQRETVAQGSPLCPVNTSYQLCGTMCEPTCDNPHPNPEFCPSLECTRFTAACRCLKGYVRDMNSNQCIELSECPSS